MVPNASEITRRRLTAATVIRLLAVLILAFGLIPMTALGVEYAEGWIDWHDFDEWGPYFVAFAILAGASAAVWCLAPWAARLMIRVPRVPVCPNCRYKLEHLVTPQCTECGYTLTPEFLSTASEREEGLREPDTVWLRQIATLVLRLGAGAFLPIGCIGCFITAVDAIQRNGWQSWSVVYAWAFVTLLAAGVTLFASNLSLLMVPGRARFGARRAPPRNPERSAPE